MGASLSDQRPGARDSSAPIASCLAAMCSNRLKLAQWKQGQKKYQSEKIISFDKHRTTPPSAQVVQFSLTNIYSDRARLRSKA